MADEIRPTLYAESPEEAAVFDAFGRAYVARFGPAFDLEQAQAALKRRQAAEAAEAAKNRAAEAGKTASAEAERDAARNAEVLGRIADTDRQIAAAVEARNRPLLALKSELEAADLPGLWNALEDAVTADYGPGGRVRGATVNAERALQEAGIPGGVVSGRCHSLIRAARRGETPEAFTFAAAEVFALLGVEI